LDGLFHSAVTDMDWVCDDAWIGPFTQAMFYLGAAIGAVIFGYISDIYGRYPTFVASNVVVLATGLTLPYCTEVYSFTLNRILMGSTLAIYFTALYLIALEYVDVSKRSLIANIMIAVGQTIAGCVEPWMLKALGDWKPFFLINASPVALIFITPFCVFESVRWLVSQGKVSRAVKIVKTIAKANGRKVTDDTFESFERFAISHREKCEAQEKKNVLTLFKSRRLRKHTIVTIIAWNFVSFLFDGHVLNLVNLDYDIYTSYTIAASLELPADLLTIWMTDNLGRKFSGFSSLLISGVSMIISGLLIDYPTGLLISAMVGRFFVSVGFNTVYMWAHEVMPTDLRAQGVSISRCIGHLVKIPANYIAFEAGNSNPAVPFYIFGIGGVIGALCLPWMPETADEKLPDTVEQAEEFGQGQTWFPMPILKRRRERLDIERTK